jgi:aerobic carbon-monoxide dehydrogenase large subunit
VVVVRSPGAHARIVRIDTRVARESAGVLAVLTAADLAGIVRPLACVMPLVSRDGTPRVEADRVALAAGKVGHVGDGVAFIVAETLEQGVDAAERIDVTYDVLPAVTAPGVSAVPVWDAAPDMCASTGNSTMRVPAGGCSTARRMSPASRCAVRVSPPCRSSRARP